MLWVNFENTTINPLVSMYKLIMNNCKPPLFVIIIFAFLAMLASCGGSKKIGYNIGGLTDSLKIELPELKSTPAVIQSDDILEIRFSGGNPQTVIDFNSKGSSYGSGTTNYNYLVDADGNIEIYLLGKVKAAGLSKTQLKEKLTAAASKYLTEANVAIRFTNFRFTIVGEVRIPGSLTILNEKISILEAVAMSGDMTNYAKRNTVRVIRDSAGVREIGTVNFNQKTLFTSPYYYLHRNDIVIVERENRGETSQILSTVSSIVGIVTSIITLFFVFKK
jgi:polysaccharide export outer membrane protein